MGPKLTHFSLRGLQCGTHNVKTMVALKACEGLLFQLIPVPPPVGVGKHGADELYSLILRDIHAALGFQPFELAQLSTGINRDLVLLGLIGLSGSGNHDHQK